MDILDRIKYYMNKHDWSEYKLSHEAKIPQSTVNSMFRNHHNPSIYTLQSICDAFHITLAEFFNEDDQYDIPQEYKELIEKWETLSNEQKKLILDIINNMN